MQPGQPSLLKKILALMAGVILLVAGFMFSLVILAFFLVIGFAVLSYFWWKTRALRKAMKQRPPDGHVIDGEAIVVDEFHSARVVGKLETPDKPD